MARLTWGKAQRATDGLVILSRGCRTIPGLVIHQDHFAGGLGETHGKDGLGRATVTFIESHIRNLEQALSWRINGRFTIVIENCPQSREDTGDGIHLVRCG